MKLSLTFIILIVTMPSSSAQPGIPSDHFSATVLIEIEGRIPASGFFLRDSLKLILVSAKHVFLNEHGTLWKKSAKLFSPPKDPKESVTQEIYLDLDGLMSSGRLHFHKTNDVAIVWLGNSGEVGGNYKLFPGVKMIHPAMSGLTTASKEIIVTYDHVFVGNDAHVLGFPASIGISKIPQFDYQRPLLRKGTIAGKFDSLRTIILDCPVYYGNSGSPLFLLTYTPGQIHYWLAGIVVQYIPFDESFANKAIPARNVLLTNSGYSVAESMDPVIELLNLAK